MAGTPIPSISLDDVASGKEEEVGGLKGVLNKFKKAYQNATVQTVVGHATTVVGKAKDWAWVIGSTAAIVVLPLMLEMEREATFQLQAELMQKNIMEMTKQAQQQQGPQLPQ